MVLTILRGVFGRVASPCAIVNWNITFNLFAEMIVGKETDLDYKLKDTVELSIALFFHSNYGRDSDNGTVARASDTLWDHNLRLDVWPPAESHGFKNGFNTLRLGSQKVNPQEDLPHIRKLMRDALARRGRPFVLPVLFCQYVGCSCGEVRYLEGGVDPVVLVGYSINDDKMTLLHEIGHAAGLSHDVQNADPNNRNFMHTTETRTTMYRFQVEKLAKARFASTLKK